MARGKIVETGKPGNGRRSRKRAAGARGMPAEPVVTVVSARRFEDAPAGLVARNHAGDELPARHRLLGFGNRSQNGGNDDGARMVAAAGIVEF